MKVFGLVLLKSGLLNKFLSFSIGNWLSAVISIVSTPIITRMIVPEEFGKASMFMLALNISMIFIIFGTNQAFVRFFYEEKQENRRKLLLNVLKLPLILFVISAFIIILFKDRISQLLFDKVHLSLIYVLVFAILLKMLNTFALLIIRMEQKGLVYSALQLLGKLIYLLAIIMLVNVVGKKFQLIIYAQVLSITFITVGGMIAGREFWKLKRICSGKLKNNIGSIFFYSYPLVLTTLLVWLFQSFDRIAIKYWSTYAELGVYAAAFQLVAILNIVQVSFTTFWVPVSLQRYEKDPADKSFFENMYKNILLVMMLIGVLCIMAKDLIVLLLGVKYHDAVNIMPFLIFMPIMYTISETTVIGITFAKKTKWNILIASLACLTNILGNCFLVPRYGAKGAAIATGLSYIVFFTFRTLISQKYYYLNLKLKKFYFLTSLLVGYALYSSFYNWGFINLFIGVSLLFMILALNLDHLHMLKKKIKLQS